MYKPTATLIAPNSVCYNIPKSPYLDRVGATSSLVSSTIYCVGGLRILNQKRLADKAQIKSKSFFNLNVIREFVQRFSPEELKFYNDISYFDLINHSWNKISYKSDNVPCPRIYCSVNISKNKLYIYGGLNEQLEILNDFWQLDLQTQTWRFLKDFSQDGDCKFLASIISINNTATFLPAGYESYSSYEWEDSVVISNGVDHAGEPSNSIICYVLSKDEILRTNLKLPRMNGNITKNFLISYPEKPTSILRDSCLYFTICDGKSYTYSLTNSSNPHFIETELPYNETVLSLVKVKIFSLINTNIIITGFKDGKIYVFLFNLTTKVLSNLSTMCELHPGNFHIAYNVYLWRNHSKLILFGYNLNNNSKELEPPILQRFEGIIFFDLAYTNLTKFSILEEVKTHLNSEAAKKHFQNACKQRLLDASMDEKDTSIDAEFPLLVTQKLDSAAAAANESNEKSRSSAATTKTTGNTPPAAGTSTGKESAFMKSSSDFESYVNYLVPESGLNLASTVYSFFNNSAIALGRNFFQRFSQNGNGGHLTDFRFISADEKVICIPLNILLKRWGPHFSYILSDAYLKHIEMVTDDMDARPITEANAASNSSRGSDYYSSVTSATADRKISPKKSIVSSIATFTMHQNSVSEYASSRNSVFFDNLLHYRSSFSMDAAAASNNLKSPVTYCLLSHNILNCSGSSSSTSNGGSSRRPSSQNNPQRPSAQNNPQQLSSQQQQPQQQHNHNQHQASQTEGLGVLSSLDDSHIRHTPMQSNRRLSTPAVFNRSASKIGSYPHPLPHSSNSPAAAAPSVAAGRFSYGTASSAQSALSGSSRNKLQDSSIITEFKSENSKIVFNSPFENNKKIAVPTSSNNRNNDAGTNKSSTTDLTPKLSELSASNILSNNQTSATGTGASHYADFLNLPSSRKNSVISNASSLFSTNSSSNNNNHTTILGSAAVAASTLHGNSASSHSVNNNNVSNSRAGSTSPPLHTAAGSGGLEPASQQSTIRQHSIGSIMDKFTSKQQAVSVPEQPAMPNFSAPLSSPPLITATPSSPAVAQGTNIPVPRTTRLGSVASASSNLSSDLSSSSSSSSPSHPASRNFHNIGEYSSYPFGDTVATVLERSQYQSEADMVSPKTKTKNTFNNSNNSASNNKFGSYYDKNTEDDNMVGAQTYQKNSPNDSNNMKPDSDNDYRRTNYDSQRGDAYSKSPKTSTETNTNNITGKSNCKSEESEVFGLLNETIEEYTKYFGSKSSQSAPSDEQSERPPLRSHETNDTSATTSSSNNLKKHFLLEPLLIPRFMYLPVKSDSVKVMCEFFLTGKLNKHTPVASVLVELYMLSKFYNIPLLHNACSEVLYAIFSKKENFVVTYSDFLDYQVEDMIKDAIKEKESIDPSDESHMKVVDEKLRKLQYLKRYYDKIIAPFGKYIRSTHGSDSFYIPIAKEFAKYNLILRKYSNNIKFDDFWSTDLNEFISNREQKSAENPINVDEYSDYEFNCDELEDLMYDTSLAIDPRFGVSNNNSDSPLEEVFKSTFIRKPSSYHQQKPTGKTSEAPELMKIEDVFDSSEPPPVEIISLIYQSTVLLGDTKFMLRCLHLLKTHKIVTEFKKPVEKKLEENLIAELRKEEKILKEQKEKEDQLKLKQSMKDAEQRKKEKLRVEEFERIKVEKERLKEEQRLRKLKRREHQQKYHNHHHQFKNDSSNSMKNLRGDTDLVPLDSNSGKHSANRHPELDNKQISYTAVSASHNATEHSGTSGYNNGVFKQQNKSMTSLSSDISSNTSKFHAIDRANTDGKDKITEGMRLNSTGDTSHLNDNLEYSYAPSVNSAGTSANSTTGLGDTGSASSRYNHHHGLFKRVTDIGTNIGLKSHRAPPIEDHSVDTSGHYPHLNRIATWINHHSINHHTNPASPKYPKAENLDTASLSSNTSSIKNKYGIHLGRKTFKFGHDTAKKPQDDAISFRSMVSSLSTKSKEKKHKET